MKDVINGSIILFILKFSFNSIGDTILYKFLNLNKEPFYSLILELLIIIVITSTLLFVFTSICDFIFKSNGYTFYEIIHENNKSLVLIPIIFYVDLFEKILESNFFNERNIKYLIATGLISLYFFVGNPFVNNYYGINSTKDLNEDGMVYFENKIFKSEDKYSIESQINYLEHEGGYDSVSKRGYIFYQAAMFDGFEMDAIESKGIGLYFECLLYSVLEKLIIIILYFAIPTFILIRIDDIIIRRKNKIA